jgi:hypothetical protein
MAEVPSRLSDGNIIYYGDNIPIQEYREKIYARSLYSLDNEYGNTNKFSLRNKGNVASGIQSVLNVVPQYNRIQTSTNLLGNVYDAFRDEGSPLSKIGLIMLGKQLAYNSAANLATKYLPTIDLSQVLKGNPTDIFKKNIDNTITIKDSSTSTFLDKVGKTASNIFGFDTYNVFGNANPFTKNPTNVDYIKNTGNAQLTRFFKSINLNPYKSINTSDNSDYTTVLREYSNNVGVNLLDGSDIINNKKFFIFDNKKQKPYFSRSLTINPIESNAIANSNMVSSYFNSGLGEIQEYGPSYQFVIENFGEIKKYQGKTNILNYVSDEPNLSYDDKNDKLVWGRDGVGVQAETYIKDLRGDYDSIDLNQDNGILDSGNNGAKTGLLNYTKNLLNASEGNFVDITRKAFKEGTNYIGFNGSPLWKSNNSKYALETGYNVDEVGIRQHTVLDPYNNFIKTIRFKGNYVYDGSENSVINKTILPKIHPIRTDDGKIDNRNLIFSLENLAVDTIKKDTYAILADEYGTAIPLSEAGPFGGRLMWFPPYNITLNETASAKYDSTVMIGRSEPMYNYMNSERTATLTFSLLVDYPEQLRNLKYQGNNKNKIIADFFAYGGDNIPIESKIDDIELRITNLKAQIDNYGTPVIQTEPPAQILPDVTIFYPNDEPHDYNVDSIIDKMYNDYHYEIIDGLNSGVNGGDGNGFGLNNSMYFVSGLTGTIVEGKQVWTLVDNSVSQYNSIDTYGQDDNFCKLNENLKNLFSDENTRKYYSIYIRSTSSKLYLGDNEDKYNKELGNRRNLAAKNLIVNKLVKMFGMSVANELELNNIVLYNSIGSVDSGTVGAKSENMHLREVKEERKTVISFGRNKVPIDKKENNLTTKEKQEIALINADIDKLTIQLNKLKKNLTEFVFNERDNYKGSLSGFESISNNQYRPVFHSQTPEDFHRRLTFLHQCTRQGPAKRYNIVDTNGQLRARNSVFGKQPICILRVGDFWHTKVIIENVTFDYNETTWDLNPEGHGLQPMLVNITLQMKIIGGQSLKGPIDALQNAATFNYYANSTFNSKEDIYKRATDVESKQNSYYFGIDTKYDENGNVTTGIMGERNKSLIKSIGGTE